MVKKLINILIFAFIFFLYFVSFLLIYDTFRERKLKSIEASALDKFDSTVKINKMTKDEVDNTSNEGFDYSGYTILGKIEIPEIGFTSVIIKEYTYSAMNVGVIKTYGSELNEEGGFILHGHNYRGRSIFMYNIRLLNPGDKIYITDTSGVKLEYTVYETLREVDPGDASYYKTFDGYHVTLVTCENSGTSRIVVKARID